MKSSKKHGARPGLWLLIILITIAAGLVFTGIRVPMQRSEKEKTAITDNETVSELEKDFKHTVDVYSDLYNVIVKGEESRYESGYEALAGRGEKKENESEEETTESHSEPITLGEESSNSENSVDLVEAALLNVVDGDTLDVSIGGTECRIRLIGIDTPESVHSEASKNTVWGTYASDHTKEILYNTATVYLEYDEEPTDKYGRTLAYVWLSTDRTNISNMLNAKILSDGYAINKEYAPNLKYAETFSDLRTNAQNTNTGLWSEEGFCELW